MIDTAETVGYSTVTVAPDDRTYRGIKYWMSNGWQSNPQVKGMQRVKTPNTPPSGTDQSWIRYFFRQHHSFAVTGFAYSQEVEPVTGKYTQDIVVEGRNSVNDSWTSLWSGSVTATDGATTYVTGLSGTTFYRHLRVRMTSVNTYGDWYITGDIDFFGTLQFPTTLSYDFSGGTGESGSSIGSFSNLEFWYDASTVSGTVTNWPDSSGNSRDLDTVGGTVVVDGSMNGQPGVYVNGAAGSGLLSSSTVPASAAQEWTLYLVAKFGGTTSVARNVSLSHVGDTNFQAVSSFGYYGQCTARGTQTSIDVRGTNANWSTPKVRVYTFDGRTLKHYLNGVLVDVNYLNGEWNPDDLYITLARTYSGVIGKPVYFGDVAFFSKAHNDNTRMAVEDVLLSKYSLTTGIS